MTDTLKKLAELFPENFEIDGAPILGTVLIVHTKNEIVKLDENGLPTTQDSIDSILAEINKRMILRVVNIGRDSPDFFLRADVYDLDWKFLATYQTGENEKLPAAQAALEVVVEELAKQKGQA